MALCFSCKDMSRFDKKCSRFCFYTPRALSLLSLFASVFLCTIGAADSTITYSVKAPFASSSLLLDGVIVDDRIVVVGERGHILISDDHGRSWSQATVPTQVTLTGVFFHDKPFNGRPKCDPVKYKYTVRQGTTSDDKTF